MTDPQAEAFRGAGRADWVTDDDLIYMINMGELMRGSDDEPIRSPEEWHARGWSADREPPKTLKEARRALRSRVRDSAAPDTDPSAYDDLEQ